MTARPVEEALRIEDLAISTNDNTDQLQKEDALEKELEGVRNLNKVMEGVITAMTKAKDNMDVHLPIIYFSFPDGRNDSRKRGSSIRYLD